MSLILSAARIIKFSLQDVGRNIWLSLVTIMIMVLTLFSVNLLLAVRAISGAAVTTIKDRIDISLYLKPEADLSQVAVLQARLSGLENVRSVDYISQADALVKFQAANKDDPKITEALNELNKNPLAPSLVIHPANTDNFDALWGDLNKIDDPVIESRNFDNYKAMLQKIDDITDKVSEAGFAVSAIFIIITLLVIYNTARVAIYTHKNEIAIMRLVGASNSFIKAPFLVSALIYTLVSSILVITVFYLFLNLLQPYLETFFAGYTFNITAYFTNNFLTIFGLEFLVAAAINLIAGWLAVSKYSNV